MTRAVHDARSMNMSRSGTTRRLAEPAKRLRAGTDRGRGAGIRMELKRARRPDEINARPAERLHANDFRFLAASRYRAPAR
jgi:hypothetical protein